MSRKKLIPILCCGALLVLLGAEIAYHYLSRPRRPDVSLGPFGKPVHRRPIPFTAEELRQAESGKAVNGLRLVLSLGYGDKFPAGTSPTIEVLLASAWPLSMTGNWIPEARGHLGLPPERCCLQAWRDGIPLPCPKRPPGPQGYTGTTVGPGEISYGLTLEDWGDFSRPGTYRVRLLYKCTRAPRTKFEWSGIVASNEIEFVVK